MITTKEQERKALAQIKDILAGLGEGSYVGTAFEGCCEIAESNIENDWACSMKDRAEAAEKNAYERYDELRELKVEMSWAEKKAERQLAETKAKLEEATSRIKELRAKLHEAQEWHDCTGGTNLEQSDYIELEDSEISREPSEEEAKELIHNELGFAVDKIEILPTAATYEANKHGVMRVKHAYTRKPMYGSSDWNYIIFAAANWVYEMIDGELYRYEC